MKKLSLSIAVLGLVAAMGAHAELAPSLLGDVVSADQAQRTVVITPSTKWVNVAQDETVKFEANGKTFAVDFNGPSTNSFNLQSLAPAGTLDHQVAVYLEPTRDITSDEN
jgi:hypothetical protein